MCIPPTCMYLRFTCTIQSESSSGRPDQEAGSLSGMGVITLACVISVVVVFLAGVAGSGRGSLSDHWCPTGQTGCYQNTVAATGQHCGTTSGRPASVRGRNTVLERAASASRREIQTGSFSKYCSPIIKVTCPFIHV